MTQPTLCFIGAGNMASSLIGGLIKNHYPASQITACDINQDKLLELQQQFGVQTEIDINQALKHADIVILAVKPQVMQQVCKSLDSTPHHPLFISIAAGIRENDINRWLGSNQAVVRCMPNTPSLVGLGACALFANPQVSPTQKSQAEQILQSTGITVWVDEENQLDAVTAISGSGPAYFFLFIEALQNAAIELGLDETTAAQLAKQTALGAATMAIDNDVVTLRQQVTSKGGTTEQAIASFQQQGLSEMVLIATQAAQLKSLELANDLGKDDSVENL